MKTQGIIGSVVMAAGGLCPLLHVPVLGNWNYFDVDQRLAIIFYVFVLAGLIGSFIQKPGVVKFAGWATIVLVLISLAGIYFKVHDSFSIIHFKKAINFAANLVKYKWGWFVILAGALILIAVRKPKTVVN
jgi:hypothetical protein